MQRGLAEYPDFDELVIFNLLLMRALSRYDIIIYAGVGLGVRTRFIQEMFL